MSETFAEWVTRHREALGKQGQAADKIGISRQTMHAIETGSIKVPKPWIRRKLAKAFGVSHLDVLVATGEITAEEVREAGVVGIVERDADPQREELVALIRNATVIPGPWIAGLRAILNPLQPGPAPIDEPALQSSPNAQ